MSCCQVFQYCTNCSEIVKQRDWINGALHLHNCGYCGRYVKKPRFCYMKSIDEVKSASLSEKIFFFDFETCCDGLETCFEVYCVVNIACKLYIYI